MQLTPKHVASRHAGKRIIKDEGRQPPPKKRERRPTSRRNEEIVCEHAREAGFPANR